MSNNNNDGGALIGLALVMAFMAALAIFIYALACFVAFIFTIIALFAWDKPMRLFGETICRPEEARLFIGSGVLGAIGAPAFALFCCILFNAPLPTGWWFYLVTGGYSFVSITVTWNLAQAQSGGQSHNANSLLIEHDPAPAAAPALPAPHPRNWGEIVLPVPESVPFRYASWDDESEAEEEISPDCRACCSALLNPDARFIKI